MITVSSWRTRLSDKFVFLWFFATTLVLVWQHKFPYLYDDEYGVLGAAAVLSGHDWMARPGMPFYGFGLSLLIAPFYNLSLDPTTLYRLVLSVNGLLIALSAVLALRTVKLIFPLSFPIPQLLQTGAVIAAFSYPAALFYAGLAMGETILLFCFTLIAYGFVSLVGQKVPKYFAPILLGLGLGLAPYAHSRGLVFWLAAVPVLWYALRARWVETKSIGVALLSGMLIAGVLSIVKSWLIANFYSGIASGSGSALDFMASKFSLLEPDKLVVLLRVAWGQLAYLATSSFGLVFVGLVAIVVVLRPSHTNGNQTVAMDESTKKQRIAAALVGLAFVLMFTVSVLQMGTPQNGDHFFYGRYNEVLLPTVLIAALLFFASFERPQCYARLTWFAAGLMLAVLLMFGVLQFPAEIFERCTYFTQITGWFVHIQGVWKIQPAIIIVGTLVGGILLAMALVLSRRAFILALMAIFTAGTLHNYEHQHRRADRFWAGYGNLAKAYGVPLSGEPIHVVGPSIYGEAMQFAFPNARVIFAGQGNSEASAILDLDGKYCTESNTMGRVGEAKLCILDTGFRNKIMQSSTPIETTPSARSCPPARIHIDQPAVETGGAVDRACALAADFFYSGWARYCLPSVEIQVSRGQLSGTERQKLGLFITNAKGKWLSEWSADLDTQELARDETIRVKSPIRFGGTTPSGNYQLNVAIVDADGWDWRSKASVRLIVK